MSGWQKLHRGLLSHWCAEDPYFLAVWVRLLLEANHSDNKSMINGKPRLVKRGQMVFGLHAFSARSGVSIGKLRRIINILLEEEMVSKQNFSKYSIITITNYEQYQSHDKHRASTEQADDKQATTLKECKEEKEVLSESDASPANCPHQEIVELYHEKCPALPRVKMLTETRKRQLRARWRSSEKHQDIDFWKKYFDYINESAFMRGENNRGWVADFDFVIKEANFTKIIEGKYHREQA